MYFGIFIKDFLTSMLCFAIRSRQITVKWYLKWGGEERNMSNIINTGREMFDQLWTGKKKKKKKKHIHEGLRHCMDGCQVTTHTVPNAFRNTEWTRVHYAADVVRMKQLSPSLFGAKVKMGLSMFTLLSGEQAWIYITGNNKRSPGPALDKHF